MAVKLYEYVLLRRPFGFATVPSNFVAFRPSRNKDYPHGVVQYSKPLSRRDVEAFELMPLDPLDPINVMRVRDAWRERMKERFSTREMLNVEDEQILGFRLLTYSTRPGVEYQVTTFQRMGPRGKGRAEPTGHIDFNELDRAIDSMLTRKLRKELVEELVPRA